MSERLTVTLKSIRFSALVGVLPHEREIAQPIEVDISVSCALGGRGGTGDLSEGVDYRHLYAIAHDCFSSQQPFFLLEDVAHAITTRVLALPRALSSRVAVRKPRVAIEGLLNYAEVVVERDRDG